MVWNSVEMMVNNNYFKNTPAGKASQARKESHSHETLKTPSLITIFKMPTYLYFYLQPYKIMIISQCHLMVNFWKCLFKVFLQLYKIHSRVPFDGLWLLFNTFLKHSVSFGPCSWREFICFMPLKCPYEKCFKNPSVFLLYQQLHLFKIAHVWQIKIDIFLLELFTWFCFSLYPVLLPDKGILENFK